ncbi:MAG: hypothetical protein GX638_00825 [Crenarchaeota archaeon]|nr:hypothetical protein [Thermoproteota archaeon]
MTENQVIKLNYKELEAYMWISIEKIKQSKIETQLRIDKVPAFVFDNVIVWGITYKILEEFLQVIEKTAKL